MNALSVVFMSFFNDRSSLSSGDVFPFSLASLPHSLVILEKSRPRAERHWWREVPGVGVLLGNVCIVSGWEGPWN